MIHGTHLLFKFFSLILSKTGHECDLQLEALIIPHVQIISELYKRHLKIMSNSKYN